MVQAARNEGHLGREADRDQRMILHSGDGPGI
jgi:hypothetical protein